jgi:hypothetical protein
MLRLDASALDYAILAIYFLVVLGIGVVARLSVKTDIDFFLSGRSLPAWSPGWPSSRPSRRRPLGSTSTRGRASGCSSWAG